MENIITAIIVAAGTGKRMNNPVKKQYMEIAGAPVLYHTLKAFEKSKVDEIVIVTGEDEIPYVREQIVEEYCIKKVVAICAGGMERCDSVHEGIKNVLKLRKADKERTDSYILIHDGVRPLVTPKLINFCIDNVLKHGACIPGVAEKDTVKEADENMDVVRTPDRKKMFRIQTPQCFSMALIKEAFDKYYKENENSEGAGTANMTDDAMLVEKYTGHKVKIIEGDYKNIKITTPEDIGLAEYYLSL